MITALCLEQIYSTWVSIKMINEGMGVLGEGTILVHLYLKTKNHTRLLSYVIFKNSWVKTIVYFPKRPPSKPPRPPFFLLLPNTISATSSKILPSPSASSNEDIRL